MLNYKMIVSYDGSNYNGWQTQHLNNSIQEAIEGALKRLYHQEIEVVASGRTDAKVHAIAQVCNFKVDNEQIQPLQIVKAMNTFLPKDIRVKSVEKVNDDFHARFSAVAKKYEYYLSKCDDIPFVKKYMGEEVKSLDFEKMCQCCKVLEGTHDYTSFTSSKIHELKNRVRTIYSINIEDCGYYYKFTLVGSSFLRYMVRMLVQTIVECGKGKISLDDVKLMLDAKSKHACKYKADACGLYLSEVYYDKESDNNES